MTVKRSVEDVYRLTELQESMIGHRLRRGAAADTGVILLRGVLRGALEAPRLERAWRATVARHPVLRSSVHWEGIRHPVQVVAPRAELPMDFEDWRGLSSRDLSARLDELVERRRGRGLDLHRAPVMRWTTLRTGELEHRFVWACHHALLDGWSSALVLREVLARYRGGPGAGREPSPRPYREYVVWSRSEEATAALESWRLAARPAIGASDSPPLCGTDWSGEASADRGFERTYESIASADVEAWARRHRVTAGTFVLGCWGLVLSEATGSDEPVLGFTASGRAAPFDGIESMVGSFANALPLRLPLARDAPPGAWFREVFAARQELQAYEHCPLPRLLEAGGYSLRRSPFDTLVAHANFPAAGPPGGAGALELEELRGDVTSAYPLTLAFLPGSAMRLEARHDRSLVSPRRLDALLDRFGELASDVLAERAATLGELLPPAAGALRVGSRGRRDGGRTARPRAGVEGSPEAPATTPTESHLMRIWNDLVEVQEYGVDDNFFDLGGHSLLVARLIERVRQDFGAELPLGVVFGSPTVRAMARAIDEDAGGGTWSSLVEIRKAETRPPLYMVHGLGGEIGWFYNLANHLDPDLPLYGLQAPAEPFEDLEAMAAHYVDEVMAHQPEGPYRLGGYCIGGGVAFEMARRLRALGEGVSLLVLIDSVPQSHAVGEQARGWMRRVRRLLGKEPREIVASVRDFGQRAARGLTRNVSSPGEAALVELADVLDLRTLPGVYRVAAARHFRAMRDYEPRPFDGDAWLFRTEDDRFGEDFGWGPLVDGRLTVERVPGRHADVLKEPHVASVGRKLAAALDASEAASKAAR